MKEADLHRQIIAEYSHGDTRLFRNHVGQFWQGQVVRRTADEITLRHPRAITVGQEGMSDIIGITKGGRYVALEVKRPDARTLPDRLTAQLRFISMVCRLGGIGAIVDSVEGAGRILERHD